MDIKSSQIIKKLAQKISSQSGRAVFVGGIVRDKLLNLHSKDVDIEVFGLNSYDQLKQIAMSSKHKLISKVYVKFDVFGTKEDICDQSIKQANFFKTLAIRCTTLALSPECLHYLKEITNNKKIECSILEFKGLSNKNIQQYSSKGILEKLTFLMRNRSIALSEDTMSFLCLYFKNYKLI